MNKQAPEYERVRIEAVGRTMNVLNLPSDEYSLAQSANRIVDRILSIKGIAIEKDDQTLPENPYNYEQECRESTSYGEAQQHTKEANFKKVI